MAFQVSPGVQVKEIDATNVVPAVSTSIGGFSGQFNWGSASEVILVGSENELVEKFGSPDLSTAKHFLTAASFLKYGNALKVVRVVASDARNASVGSTEVLLKNESDYQAQTFVEANHGEWVARCPGVLGNAISVDLCTAGATDGTNGFSSWAFKGEVDSIPGTSQMALDLNKDATFNDELHVVVYDKTGAITGTPNSVLEVFPFLSQAEDAKSPEGSSIYYKDVINAQSEYIRWAAHDVSGGGLSEAGQKMATVGAAFTVNTSVLHYDLDGGLDGAAVTHNEINAGLVLLGDAETVDVNLLFAPTDANGNGREIGLKLIEIAEGRKDCMAFISPPLADTENASAPHTNVIDYASGLNSSSYASMDSGAVYVYDKYNDGYQYIGASGLVAGLCANTDQVADAWFSPAGVTRGQLRGVTKLAFNPTKSQRDELYKARVNPLVSFPGQGTMLFGDKTLLSRASAFDRINVRRLFVTVEKAISTAAKAQLFEFNDEFTRAQFRNLLEPFLRDVKGRRGITDFLVVCDDSNNTGQVVDSNRFVADIFIKPARSINFITLNFIATRTGVSFNEVAG
jgi:phage tail sheath protein FI